MGLTTMRIVGGNVGANNAGASGGVTVGFPARLYSVTVFNNSGADVYVLVLDSSTMPADGTTPNLVMKVLNDSQGSFDYQDGKIFTSGIAVAFSTTVAQLTTTTTANSFIDITYRKT